MKASGKIGSSGVYVSDNVEKRFEIDIHTYRNITELRKVWPMPTSYKMLM